LASIKPVLLQQGCLLNINIPNFITLARVMSVPVIFWLLLTGQTQTAFWIFLCAGLSDALDGWLAKRFNWTSELGAFLDPLADKLLIVSIYIALAVRAELPLWLVIMVVSRDILIVAAVLISWVMDQPVVIKPLAVSKANTLAQIVLAATVLADNAFGFGLADTRTWLVWITGALTLLSLAAYLKAWLMHMTGYESGKDAST
jgi:cardiolipin synthase